MVEFIPLDSIKILDGRQRKHFSAESIAELADSIQKTQLLHAVILRKDADVLVAGERRLRAITLLYSLGGTFKYNEQDVPPGMVPFTRIAEDSEIAAYEAELIENIQRSNLTIQEEMAAIAQLHDLRTSQNPKQTHRQTAEEINNYEDTSHTQVAKVKTAVLVSKYKDLPEVKAAKTEKQIRTAVERVVKKEHARKLAEAFDLEKSKSEDSHKHVALKGDAFEFLQKMPSKCVDVLLTDPIYGIDAQDFGSQTALGHQYDDSYEVWKETMPILAAETYRVCKSQAHAYVFCAWERFEELKKIFSSVGWEVWPKPIIWAKGNLGMLPKPEHGPRFSYELVLYANKGQKKTQRIGQDVLFFPAKKLKEHAAEKPVELYMELLSRSVLPGDHVLDCFFGSGVIFPAANAMQVRATGFELNPEAFGVGVQRLNEHPTYKEAEAEVEEINLGELFNG